MLSIQELRAMLGRGDLSDEEVDRVRDDLRCLARAAIEAYLRERRTPSPRRRA